MQPLPTQRAHINFMVSIVSKGPFPLLMIFSNEMVWTPSQEMSQVVIIVIMYFA